jgi:ABC-type antimicrobial peptide transport system permease subunit
VIADVASEVALIATGGAIAAVLIGDWSMRILAAVTPADLPWLGFREPHWSPWVFAGLFGVVMLVVGVASIVPAVFVSRIAPIEQLKDNSGTTTGRPRRTFQLLVVSELALSLILLFGAVLVAKSADRVAEFDFGYEPRGLTVVAAQARVRNGTEPLASSRAGGQRIVPVVTFSQVDDIVTRLRREPGVRDVSWAASANTRFPVVSDETRQLLGDVRMYAGPGLLATLGLRLLEGRDFIETDRLGSGAVILDEIAARRLFPNATAVGHMVKFGPARSRERLMRVVGVVRSAIHIFPDDPAVAVKPSVYIAQPFTGAESIYGVRFVFRGERGVNDIGPRVATIIGDLLPPRVAYQTSPWLSRYDQVLTTRRFTGGMFLTMSFASLALAVAGLFGVLSYVVNQRMREFAVRVALGAQRKHVIKLVLTEGFIMALGGTAIGGAVAMYAAFVLWEWLWGVYPVDAQALMISEGMLLLITAMGAILPSLRATRANPVDVMRAT